MDTLGSVMSPPKDSVRAQQKSKKHFSLKCFYYAHTNFQKTLPTLISSMQHYIISEKRKKHISTQNAILKAKNINITQNTQGFKNKIGHSNCYD